MLNKIKNEYMRLLYKIGKKYFMTTETSSFLIGKGHYYKSFSQYGEDMILRTIFMNKENSNKGFYVDIGAHDPFKFSNTQYFYEKGWRGINIEPNPESINNFNQARQEDINLEIGVSSRQDILTYYKFDEPAFNTFDKEIAQSREETSLSKIFETVDIPVYPLSYILDKYIPVGQQIDFLSIDAEGMDFEILKSNNWEKYRPTVLIIENSCQNISDIINSQITIYLAAKNYDIVAKTPLNLIYMNKN